VEKSLNNDTYPHPPVNRPVKLYGKRMGKSTKDGGKQPNFGASSHRDTLRVNKKINGFVKIPIQFLVCEWNGCLMPGIGQFNRAYLREVLLQDLMRGLEAQERIIDRHGKVTRGFGPFRLDVKFRIQYLVDLGI
jgi:hypothetical protein